MHGDNWRSQSERVDMERYIAAIEYCCLHIWCVKLLELDFQYTVLNIIH